ncbi:hypothetical protein FB446DRAFT_638770, partial [Lentinula raphanica]
GPNHTRQLIFKRSVLLEVYRAMQETIEDNFFFTHRTVQHSKPTMTNTLRKLSEIVSALDSTILKPGRLSSIPGHQDRWEVQDVIIEGFAILAQKKELLIGNVFDEVDEAEANKSLHSREIDGYDIGVE